MKRWPPKTLGDFCRTGSGATPSRSKPEYFDGGTVPWVKSGELKETIVLNTAEKITPAATKETNAHIVPKNAVLVAMYGATVGKTAILGMAAATNQAVCHIIPDPSTAHFRFVWYALKSQLDELLSKRVGGAQPNISQGIIRDTVIPVPPLAEQERIVTLLDEADELRKLRAEADSRTAALLPALFNEMFGDETGQNSTPLGDVCHKITDGVHITPTYIDEGVPFLRVTNIQDEDIRWDEVKRIPQSEYHDITRRVRPQRGDVLYSKNGTVGIAKEITWDRPFAHFVSLALLKPNREILNPTFLTAWLNTPDALRQAIGRSKTGTVTNLHLNEIRRMRIPCPPMETQLLFVTRLTDIRAMESAQAASRQRLDNLFQSMLHRAFAGEI